MSVPIDPQPDADTLVLRVGIIRARLAAAGILPETSVFYQECIDALRAGARYEVRADETGARFLFVDVHGRAYRVTLDAEDRDEGLRGGPSSRLRWTR